MRKLLTLAFALMLTSSMAMAQNNEATVEQDGSGHSADVEQSGSNTAAITQAGADHSADVEQIGTGNSVNSLQDRPGAATNRNNRLEAFQDGESNVVESTQRGAHMITTTYQLGDNNRIATESGGWGVEVQGLRNETDIRQVGDDNEALVRAEGNDNRATITQGDELQGSYGSAARIRFNDGHNNSATINQYGTGNDAGAYIRESNNRVNIDQIGNRNLADLDGGSWGSYGVNVRGNNNQVDVYQLGDDNETFVRIGGASGSGNLSNRNAVDVLQDGDQNTADIVVEGGSLRNTVDLDQLGRNNMATSLQAGENHSAVIMQNGGGNTANVQQSN